MKKRYVVFTIFLAFLIFLPISFGASDNLWKKCSYLNDEKGDTNHHINLGINLDFYCCNNKGTHEWQLNKECCIDNDEDGYGAGCSLGPDCDDDTSGDPSGVACPIDPLDCENKYSKCAICMNPGATEICDGVDNDCSDSVHSNGVAAADIDEGCDDDADGYANKKMPCNGYFTGGEYLDPREVDLL